MDKQCSGRELCGVASRLWLTTAVAMAAMCLCGVAPAEAQFDSGSSGIHGVFPPPDPSGTVPSTTNIVWNIRTGGVRYCSFYTTGTGSDQCDGTSGTNVF